MGLFQTCPCDPNILGFSSDIARQVDQFSACIVYCHLVTGLKLSIRSTVREIMVNELVIFLTQETGSGGGGIEKAGAHISFSGIERIAPHMSPDAYLQARIRQYQNNFDLIYCDRHPLDFSAAEWFIKLKQPVGCACSADLFPDSTPICVRTLEGDINLVASKDIYIMIGVKNEVYPIGVKNSSANTRLQMKAIAPPPNIRLRSSKC
jgi:phosphoglycolate phosphatase